jgi:hypothetical protein
MARNSAGKWVARAGATGGSRSYRGQTPINWYAALTVIVVLGVLSVALALYEYRNPSSAATTTTPPTTKTTWYAGITFDICGKVQPPLASNAPATGKSKSFFTTGQGVITIHPQSDSDAGKNAVLGRFVSGYEGLTLTATQLGLHPPGSTKYTSKIYKNGDTCPKGTPDHGKTGEVQVTYWPSAYTSGGKAKTVEGDPSTLRFTDHQLISVGFVPPGTSLAKPSGSIVTAVLQKTAASSSPTSTPTTSSTATTAAPTATTTAPTTAPTTKK